MAYLGLRAGIHVSLRRWEELETSSLTLPKMYAQLQLPFRLHVFVVESGELFCSTGQSASNCFERHISSVLLVWYYTGRDLSILGTVQYPDVGRYFLIDLYDNLEYTNGAEVRTVILLTILKKND